MRIFPAPRMAVIGLPAACWAAVVAYVDDVDASRASTAIREVRGVGRDRRQRKAALVGSMPAAVVALFGGAGTVGRFRQLEWDDRYFGPTGYIDQLQATDMPAAIAIGCDSWSRPFLAIRSAIVDEHGDQRWRTVDVLFQRYTDPDGAWSNASSGGSGLPMRCGHFLEAGVVREEFLASNLASLVASWQAGSGRFTTRQRTLFAPFVDVIEVQRQLI